MDERQREDALNYRRVRRFPKHSLPHFDFEGEHQFIVTTACYEHAHIIGKNHERMTECEEDILNICQKFCIETYAWSLLSGMKIA